MRSWKIMEIWFPRISRISSSGMSIRFFPSNVMVPPTMRPGRSMSRMTDSAVTLLPQPDSPTTPSVAPLRMLKLTPSTAFTRPSAVAKCVCRSLIWRSVRSSSCLTIASGLDPLPRVEGVPEAVAEEDGGQYEEDQGDARVPDPQRLPVEVVLGVRQHVAQAGLG